VPHTKIDRLCRTPQRFLFGRAFIYSRAAHWLVDPAPLSPYSPRVPQRPRPGHQIVPALVRFWFDPFQTNTSRSAVTSAHMVAQMFDACKHPEQDLQQKSPEEAPGFWS
jgi:hypothetical protein